MTTIRHYEIIYDYDDSFGKGTIHEDKYLTYFEMLAYVKKLNDDPRYSMIEAIDLDNIYTGGYL